MTRAIGYIRVSTDGQAEEGISLDAQRAKLQAFAIAADLDLVDIRCDAGVSAKTLARPGLQATLTDLREGRADALLVCKLDRLTRSVRDLGALLEGYFAAKFSLLSVGDSIDTRTAAGRLVLHVLTSVAQWEREAIGERTRDALAHLKAKGARLGGEAIGWRRTADTDSEGRRMWIPVLEEQATAVRIRELRTAGLSLRGICEALAREGRHTKRGGRWAPQTVKQVLARAA